MFSHSVNKYFSERLDVQSTLGIYSMLSGRGLFRSLHFFPTWIQMAFSKLLPALHTMLYVPLCPPAILSTQGKPCPQAAMMPFPITPTHASLPSSSTTALLQATCQDTSLCHPELLLDWCIVFILQVIAKVLAMVGLAIKSNSFRSQDLTAILWKTPM